MRAHASMAYIIAHAVVAYCTRALTPSIYIHVNAQVQPLLLFAGHASTRRVCLPRRLLRPAPRPRRPRAARRLALSTGGWRRQ